MSQPIDVAFSELVAGLEPEPNVITCDWAKVMTHGGICMEPSSYRVGFDCCADWSLVCLQHAAYLNQWIMANAEREVECQVHQSHGLLAAFMHLHAL